MDLVLSDEQAMLADAAGRFAQQEAATPFTRERWRTMQALGWLDLPRLESALVCEALGRGPVPSPLVVSNALRALVPGDRIATLASITGPRPGTLLLVPWADTADVVVAATTSGLVAVDAAAVAVTRHDDLGADPLFAIELGDAGQHLAGLDALPAIVDTAAVLQLAYVVGAGARALELVVQHARDRQQFGRPIGSFQAVAHRCVDIRTDLDGCRQLAYRAAWALDRARPAEVEVASALAYASDAMRRIFANAHQVMGAIGFSTEHDLHRYTRYAKSFELTYGTATRPLERVAVAMGLG